MPSQAEPGFFSRRFGAVMSNEYGIALIMGLFIAAMLVYVLLDRTYQNRLDAVASGFVQGVRAPAGYRELLLYTRLLPFVSVVVSPLLFCGIGWIMLAEEIADQGVRLLAYLAVFVVACAAVGWLSLCTVQFLYFRRLLRQAESN
jgi:hypothetical protein